MDLETAPEWSESEQQALHDVIYMQTFLKNDTNELTYKTETSSQT